jgi:lycopene cyclase domain-containing protein
MGALTYLFLILIWAGPLIAVQWLIGADILLKRWKVLMPGILVPALYLTIVDSFALRATIWTINPTQSLNLFIPLLHVPVEEFVFFVVTNTLVVQGLISLWMPEMRQRIRNLIRLLIRLARRGPAAIEPESGD